MAHISKDFDRIIEKMRLLNYRVIQNGVTYKIYPADKSLPMFTAHKGERGFHPLRRYLKNVCKIEE